MSEPAQESQLPSAALSGGIPIRNIWYMLMYAWNEMPYSRYWLMGEVEDSPTLDALLASILISTMKQRLRIGLGCSYIPEQHLLRGVRGRIHFSKSLKMRAFERGRAFCEFENYTMNAPKNQIIRSTLDHLAKAGDFGADKILGDNLRHSIRWMVRTLDGIDLIELTPDLIHRQQAHRHDHDYRIMLSICSFLLQKRLPTEERGSECLSQLERDRLVLHRVYELFVSNFYRHHLRNWSVRPQKQLSWHERVPVQYLPKMRPDLILREPSGQMYVLDTKLTPHSLKEGQWGKEIFDSGHLYQIYTYLNTQDHVSQEHQEAKGILLYPTVRDELSEEIQLPEHSIRIETVNLAANWEDIEERLMRILIN